MEDNKVLITGAAGFLGSHLCDRFIKDGCVVIGMDNLITGRISNLEQAYLMDQLDSERSANFAPVDQVQTKRQSIFSSVNQAHITTKGLIET